MGRRNKSYDLEEAALSDNDQDNQEQQEQPEIQDKDEEESIENQTAPYDVPKVTVFETGVPINMIQGDYNCTITPVGSKTSLSTT